MPLVSTDPTRPVPFDRLAVVELSNHLFGSWGVSWVDAIKLPQHTDMLNLFLRVLGWAVDADVDTYLETVVDARDRATRAHSFRLWVPLHGASLARFVSTVAAGLPAFEEPPAKRQCVDVPAFSGRHMCTRRKVLEALRIYGGAADLFDVVATPVVADDPMPTTHILRILDGEARLRRCQKTYLASGVGPDQRFYDNYASSADNGRTWSFVPPESAVARGLVRRLRPSMLGTGDALLEYHLPHLKPAEHQLESALSSVRHATGVDDVVGSADPCMYSQICFEDAPDTGTVIDGLLKAVYPVMERVRNATLARLLDGDRDAVTADVVGQLETLYSVKVEGVPYVYSQLRAESRARVARMKAPAGHSKALRLAQAMFWRKQAAELTPFGNLMALLVAGVCSACRLLPSQRRLWLLLYCRSFKVVHNCTGANAYVIVAGPSETGKSMVCQDVMECMPRALVSTNDGESAKAHTAEDLDGDLRVQYMDELHGHCGDNDDDTKRQQTLVSTGVIMTSRLVRQADGQWAKQKTLAVRRALTFTCTNTLEDVSAPMKSRATIVAVAAQKMPGPDAATLASVGAQKDNIREGFVICCQTLTSTQVDFWGAEAAGLLTIEDSMCLLYKVICNALPGAFDVTARAMDGIRQLAISNLVMDLQSQWHRLGVGARHGWCPKAQARWFQHNAVVKMEHVLASVAILTNTTSVRPERDAVEASLRNMIRRDAFLAPVQSADRGHYVLATSRRRFEDEVAAANPALGPGLAKALLKAIVLESTAGQANIKFDVVDRDEVVFVSRAFIASTETAVDRALFDALKAVAPTSAPLVSWCGKFFVYPQSVRSAFADPSDAGARAKFAALRDVTEGEYKLAIAILKDRRIGGERVWHEATSCEVRVEVDAAGPLTACVDGKHYIKRSVHVPLVVHMGAHQANREALAASAAQMAAFATALAVAGGYSATVGLGIDVHAEDLETVRAAEVASVTVDNPLFLKRSHVDQLLGEHADDRHPIFPSDVPRITFTHESNLEALCFDRARCAK